MIITDGDMYEFSLRVAIFNEITGDGGSSCVPGCVWHVVSKVVVKWFAQYADAQVYSPMNVSNLTVLVLL